jgi:hypothetical protein
MSEPTSPTPPSPETAAEAPKPADSAQKKQTVRISLPPKPAGGPSIKIPAPVAAPTASAQTAMSVAAPVAAAPSVAAAPAAKSAPAPAAAPAPSRPTAPPAARPAAVSMLDVGLAFATVLVGIAIAVMIFIEAPKGS